MPKLRLTETDRERLGVDGDLPVDLSGITNREAIALRALGFPTPRLFRAALFEAENPSPLAVTGLVWMCLRRAGVAADIETVEFDLDGLDWVLDAVVEPEPGKAPAGPGGSTSSTRRRSTSSATSKAKSKDTSSPS